VPDSKLGSGESAIAHKIIATEHGGSYYNLLMEQNFHSESPASTIKIVVVDDHKVVADAIHALLESTPGFSVAARVYDPTKIGIALAAHTPDIVLCDLEMPGGDPLQSAADGVASSSPKTRIVVLTAFPTGAHLQRAIDCGVSGFLTKHESAETVVDGLRAVAAGHAIFSDEVRDRFIEKPGHSMIEKIGRAHV